MTSPGESGPAAKSIRGRRVGDDHQEHGMQTLLFHLLARTAGERVRIVFGTGPRAFPDMVIYNPPESWEWPERYLFRPQRGDVLEIMSTYEANGERWHEVPYIDEDALRISICPGIRASSTIAITAKTANDEALAIMRLRMRDWLDHRNEWAGLHAITEPYSHTSMAADVAPWLVDDIDQAIAICERAGWPE